MLLGVLIGLNILGFYGLVTSILASGGITAVVLGFAFKDIGENFLAGFFMAFSRPFRTGDLIASEGLAIRIFGRPTVAMYSYRALNFFPSHSTTIPGTDYEGDRLL